MTATILRMCLGPEVLFCPGRMEANSCQPQGNKDQETQITRRCWKPPWSWLMLSCVIFCLTFQDVKVMTEQCLSKPQPIAIAQSGNQFLCLAESECCTSHMPHRPLCAEKLSGMLSLPKVRSAE